MLAPNGWLGQAKKFLLVSFGAVAARPARRRNCLCTRTVRAPRRTSSAAATTTTTTCTSMVEQQQPYDVNLVWKTENDKTVVSLQKRQSAEAQPAAVDVLEQSPPANNVDHIEQNEQTAIPASVLTYERQLRKAQHAKKAGRVLDPDNDLQVVYVDESIVVVNKPPGVLTVPGVNNNSSLLDLVHTAYCNNNNDNNTDAVDPATLIVHRLDMDTSGLVVFARTPRVAATLHTTFRDRLVKKEYESLVMGHAFFGSETSNSSNNSQQASSMIIDLPLQKDHEHPPFMRVSTPNSECAAQQAVRDLQQHGWKKLVAKKAKPSQTSVRVVERGYKDDDGDKRLPYTRLRLVPITGRTHQLRVHCAALGYPIVGDPTYGLYGEAAPMGGLLDNHVPIILSVSATAEKTEIPRCSLAVQKAWTAHHPPNEQPMCLHAALLELPHPVTGERMRWEIPPDF